MTRDPQNYIPPGALKRAQNGLRRVLNRRRPRYASRSLPARSELAWRDGHGPELLTGLVLVGILIARILGWLPEATRPIILAITFLLAYQALTNSSLKK
jgi:hypothetical protein